MENMTQTGFCRGMIGPIQKTLPASLKPEMVHEHVQCKHQNKSMTVFILEDTLSV